jgi:hypothetical protein
MNKNINKFSKNILSLHRYSKRTIAIITDMAGSGMGDSMGDAWVTLMVPWETHG